MTKALTICLLFIFSVTQTELGQLLKIPFLLEHFSRHRQENKSLTFIDFLKDHYSKDHQDQDLAEDSKLPFLSSISQSYNAAIVPVTIMPQKPVKSMSGKHRLLNDQHSLPQAFHSIFHPPQGIIG